MEEDGVDDKIYDEHLKLLASKIKFYEEI